MQLIEVTDLPQSAAGKGKAGRHGDVVLRISWELFALIAHL